MLEVNHLSLTINDISILKKMSFSLPTGQLIAVIGPNGAGKTSLLKLLAGDDPTTGEVFFNRTCLQIWPVKEKAKQLAVLTQHSYLSFPFTVEEVVVLGRQPHATGKDVDDVIVQKALQALDIEPLAKRLYPELSGGEKQRVQLARVLAQVWQDEADSPVGKQTLLVLDEPLTALDIGHQQQVMALLKKLAAQGMTVVAALHDLQLVMDTADQVLALNDGEMIANGSAADVITESFLKDIYGVNGKLIANPETGRPMISFGDY